MHMALGINCEDKESNCSVYGRDLQGCQEMAVQVVDVGYLRRFSSCQLRIRRESLVVIRLERHAWGGQKEEGR